jgi:hypothetical protein
MQHLPNPAGVRVEVVTSAFVASGRPEGVHDLGRLLENLNHPGLSGDLELHAPAIRPLYASAPQLDLGAPLLIRRDDIIFLNFEGPHYTRGNTNGFHEDLPVLLIAPPFQIQGVVAIARGAEPTPALRTLGQAFFVVYQSQVFDADGAALGEGEQIVVNGRAMQMLSATARRIQAQRTPTPAPARETRARDEAVERPEAAPEKRPRRDTRAA